MFKVRYPIVGLLVVLVSLGIGGALNIAQQEQPRYGGTLIVPMPYGHESIETMDPIMTELQAEWIIAEQIYDRLIDHNPTLTEFYPNLAKDWTISDDHLTYTFYLNEGVKFTDGTELTCTDVKFSFERILSPDWGQKHAWRFEAIEGAKEFENGEAEEVSGIKCLDHYTVEITLERPDWGFLRQVSNVVASIVSKEYVDKVGKDGLSHEPMGTGPFKLAEWKRGTEVVLAANEDHFSGRPYLDKLIFRSMPELSTREAAFRAGEIDARLLGPQYYSVYAEDPKWKPNLIETAEWFTIQVRFNMNFEPFKDKRVRQAWNYAIPTQLLLDKVLHGLGYKAHGDLPFSLVPGAENIRGYEYNPDLAKQLMKEAGYEDGFDVTVLGTADPRWGIPWVEATVPYLQKIGIRVKLVQLDGLELYSRISKGDFQAHIWAYGEPDPVRYLEVFSCKTSVEGGNWGSYCNEEFDKLLDMAKETFDTKTRFLLTRAADRVLLDDPPIWFSHYNKAVYIHQPWVHGMTAVPYEMTRQPFKKVWVDETSPRA